MPIENLQHWFLKKHDNGEVFGPVHFSQIVEWAHAAQVNPQDMLSADGNVWTKAPMVTELEMDWLIELADHLLYGPTTAGALTEFAKVGEIHRETMVINCRTGEMMTLCEAPFFSEDMLRPAAPDQPALQPVKGGIKVHLQKRMRELETALIEKRLQLKIATDTIAKQDARIKELEAQLKDIRSGRKNP
jgi:hypothetical protein